MIFNHLRLFSSEISLNSLVSYRVKKNLKIDLDLLSRVFETIVKHELADIGRL